MRDFDLKKRVEFWPRCVIIENMSSPAFCFCPPRSCNLPCTESCSLPLRRPRFSTWKVPQMESMAYRREDSGSASPDRKCAEVRTTAEINGFIAHVIAELGQAGFCERDRFAVRLALEEAIINAIKHGNREDPAKLVRVSYSINSGEIITEIEDQGSGFNP